MKKLILSLFLCLVTSMGFPCSGVYFANGAVDAQNIADDFFNNCCEGSVIVIVRVDNGEQIPLLAPSDGLNSSCGTFVA